MGNAASSGPLYHLTPEHLARLQRQFLRLSRGQARATIQDLQKLPELAGNPLVPRIFQLIDTDGDGRLTMEEFIAAVRQFATLVNDDDLYEFAFTVYDQDEDGLISAEELYELLHSFLGCSYSDHQLQQVVQATMRQYAKTHEWKLTIDEFAQLADAQDLRSKLNVRL